MKFSRKVLEGYLVVAIAILTVVTFIVLGGVGLEQESGSVMLSILLIILIAVNILVAIIQLRVLERLEIMDHYQRKQDGVDVEDDPVERDADA